MCVDLQCGKGPAPESVVLKAARRSKSTCFGSSWFREVLKKFVNKTTVATNLTVIHVKKVLASSV